MKKSIYLAIFLAWISAVAGGFLAVVNYMTAPVIAENAAKAEAENLVKIFTNGETFAAIDFKSESGNPIVGIYSAGDTGYAYKVTVKGYSSDITYLVGVDTAGSFLGFEVLAIADTAGIGTKVADDGFKQSVIGKGLNDSVDTISGATISSSAVVRGLDAVRAHFSANFE